ncbi:MAG: protein kinase [Myxococcaceae bacterium]|nr:protein kinase [Myxococcaceae bacterium]
MDEKLGKYRLLSLLATGGMGEVFLARLEGRAGFSKTVVVKRILRHLANDQGFIDMFRNEALLAAQLQHPNIVQIFELDREDDTWFIAMEHVHGRSLRATLQQAQAKQRRFPPRLAARVAAQALAGLHFAHRLTDERGKPLGILHRDVSPDNVLVSFTGEVKLVDFGIAKAMSGALMTRTGRLKGKFAYMAPEQFTPGAIIDARIDVYAMGVLLHELLTNELPSSVPRSPEEVLQSRKRFEPRAELPEGLNAVLQRALELDARDRFESAEAMAAALESYVQSTGEPMMGTHVARFLSELFGADVVSANPAVAPLSSNTGPGGGTAVLSQGSPVLSPVDHLHSTAILPGRSTPAPALVPLPDEKPNRVQAWWPAIALALLAVAVLAAVELVSARPEVKPVVAVTPPEPTPVAAPPEVSDAAVEVEEDAGRPAVVVVEVPVLVPVPAAPVDAGAPGPAEKPDKLVRKKPPPKPGHVVVRANPWAEVFLGGKSYGITPLRSALEVPAGKVTLTLKNSQLGVVKTYTVKVGPGETVTLKADLFKR